MDTLTTLLAAGASFGAGVVAGRTILAPPAPRPPLPAPEPTRMALPPSDVARALAVHGAQEQFDPAAPSHDALVSDVGQFGDARYAAGQDDTLDLVRFDLDRIARALADGDTAAATDALDALHGRVADELGRALHDVEGIPTWTPSDSA